MAQVKGVAILGFIKFIKKYMKDALPKIIAAMPPETRKYMDEHIVLTRWYPYKLYTDLLKALDNIAGTGDLSYCVEQGRLSAKHDLSTVYKIFLESVSINTIMTRSMSMWSSYYDTGRVDFNLPSDNELIYTINEFPDIDIAHVKNVQGWFEQFMSMSGFKDVKSEIAKCQCYGDPVTEMKFKFKQKTA